MTEKTAAEKLAARFTSLKYDEVSADASQRLWYACSVVAVHAVSRAPLKKALDFTSTRAEVHVPDLGQIGSIRSCDSRLLYIH